MFFCATESSKRKVSEIVNSESPEAKNHDFWVADTFVKGDMKFIHIELYCNQCNKDYAIKEAKKIKF